MHLMFGIVWGFQAGTQKTPSAQLPPLSRVFSRLNAHQRDGDIFLTFHSPKLSKRHGTDNATRINRA